MGKRGVKRFLHSSTESILFRASSSNDLLADNALLSDDMPGPYTRSKMLAERLALQVATSGYPVVIGCPTMPIGPHDHNVTPPAAMLRHFLDRRLQLYLDFAVNLVDVRDVAEGLILAMERGRAGHRYILGGETIPLKQVLEPHVTALEMGLHGPGRAMAILADASRLLAESLDSEQILFTISRMVVPGFADGVAIYLTNPQGELRFRLYHAADPELLAAVEELQRKSTYRVAAPHRRVVQTGRPELHPTVTPEWILAQEADEELVPVIRRFGSPSIIYVPIIVGGRTFGVIAFTAAPPRVYNERDLVFAEELARRASMAMQNAELFQTAKQERERAEESATLRERLVAIVGHDLRNPLQAIMTLASALENSSVLTTGGEDLIRAIQQSANRMARMISQILDFARIRSGQSFDLQFESADLRQFCQSVVDEFGLSRPGKEIVLSIEGRTDVLFDCDRMAQVLVNLIGNAIQHGTGGSISVTVRDATPDAVAIEVHNFGPEIPKDAQAGLFAAFNRRPTARGDGSSVGLGLFIANQIVRAHGGSIAVLSPDRDGTTFSVVLPRRPVGSWNPVESSQPQHH